MSERCFRLLGITENANAEQIEHAYNKKVAHYKGPDYAEEPEYVHQKLMELKAAYADCLRRVGASPILTMPKGSSKKKDKSKSKKKITVESFAGLFDKDEEKPKKKGTVKVTMPNLGSAFDDLKKHVEGTTGKSIGKLIPSVLSLIIAIAAIAMPFGDSDSLPDYSEEELSGVANYEELGERDQKIMGYASSISSFLYEQTQYGSSIWTTGTSYDFEEEANLFAQNYWNLDTIDEVTEYLYDTYPNYGVYSDVGWEEQLDRIFEFYGFVPVEDVQWYDNPYTDERMSNYGDYLDFLNAYFDEMQLEYQL